VPILPSSLLSSIEHLDSLSLRFASPGGRDVTTTSDDHVIDHVTSTLNATAPTLRFRLADDSFYDWIAEGGGGGDVSRRLMGESPAARFWERWLDSNWTVLPNATSDDDYESLLAALDVVDSSSAVPGTETTTDRRRENTSVNWMYWTKTVVQLLAAPLVGFIANRCALHGIRYVTSTLKRLSQVYDKTQNLKRKTFAAAS